MQRPTSAVERMLEALDLAGPKEVKVSPKEAKVDLEDLDMLVTVATRRETV